MCDGENIDPEISSEIILRVPDHQTLLSFNSDDENEIFQLWWNRSGFDRFSDFYRAYAQRHGQ